MTDATKGEGTCDTTWWGDETLRTTFIGKITHAVSERGRMQAFDLLEKRAAKLWVIDVSEISTFDAAVRTSGFQWLRDFRTRGGREVVVVMRSAAVRMLASALSFGAGMPMKMVGTIDEAIAHIHARHGIALTRAGR